MTSARSSVRCTVAGTTASVGSAPRRRARPRRTTRRPLRRRSPCGQRRRAPARGGWRPRAPPSGDLGEDGGVLRRVGDDADVTRVLRGGAHHGRPADVDELDRRVRGEGIEVADDEVDGGDVVLVEAPQVLGFRRVGEDPAVEPRVQRLHATVEHLGKTGHVRDVQVRDTGVARASAVPPEATSSTP